MKKYERLALCIVGIILLFVVLYFSVGCGEKHVYINEVCSNNFSTGVIEGYEDCDWIEIYNPTREKVFLGDYYLSDDRSDIKKCKLPDVYINADGYYVLYASGTENVIDYDLDLKICSKGEALYLSKGNQVVNQVSVPQLEANVTWSRMKLGGEWAKTESTIGASNAMAIAKSIVGTPVFSREGGFYEEKFYLKLEGKGSIFYTLDGSEPDSDSLKYTEPIEIINVSDYPNLHSARTDLSTVSSYVPEELVDKLMVVRAVCIDKDGNKSDIVTNSYLIGYQDMEAYKEMYTVSLVTDPFNLFDYKKGIYVLGETYDQYLLENGSMEDAVQIPANYRKKGKASEKEGNIEIWDENGNDVLDRKVGMRIHGASTRGAIQKSFSIYAREMYDGKGVFDEGLFDSGDIIRKFLIYSDRDQSKLKHILNQNLVHNRNVETQKFIRCNVFLDGEYWGVYSLAEVYDEYYFQNHYGIPYDNVEICESATPTSVVEFLDSSKDVLSDQIYKEFLDMVDIQSLIDYYASMIYIDNFDWLPGNAICWRSISKGNHEKEDGKWRWAIWDTEGSEMSYERNTFTNGNVSCWKDDPIITVLLKNEDFRRNFVLSFMDLVNNNFEEKRVLAEIDGLAREYEESYKLNKIRYLGEYDIRKDVEFLKDFFINRKDRIVNYLKQELGLSGSPVYLAVILEKENIAEICVNSITKKKGCSFWQGEYFSDYPINVSVKNIDSKKRFLGWFDENGILISTEYEMVVELGAETKVIYAKFDD